METGFMKGKRVIATFSVALFAVIGGCASIPNRPPRPPPSSLCCMQAVVREKVSRDLHDKLQHCLAAGFIARYCSRIEARIAGVGKEVADLFTGGDAQWSDLQADWKGIRCARDARDDRELSECCGVEQ